MNEEEILKECNQLFVTMVNCHINGKPMADLFALYEQEKEKNKKLKMELEVEKTDNIYNKEETTEETIPKYKIREKIQELEKRYTEHCYFQYDKKEVLDICINELKELLEEK